LPELESRDLVRISLELEDCAESVARLVRVRARARARARDRDRDRDRARDRAGARFRVSSLRMPTLT